MSPPEKFFMTTPIKIEPPHDKTNNVAVRPAKTHISLGIRPVWSESSLSAWRKLGSLATHWAYSEDSDKSGRMPRLIWVFDGRTCHFVGLSWGGSNGSDLLNGSQTHCWPHQRAQIATIQMELPWSDWSCSWPALFSKTCRYEDIGSLRYFYLIIWATSWENLFLLYANNKDADQPVHLRSLISVFGIRCLDSLIRLVSISEISGL